jgi:hypothetical protein
LDEGRLARGWKLTAKGLRDEAEGMRNNRRSLTSFGMTTLVKS